MEIALWLLFDVNDISIWTGRVGDYSHIDLTPILRQNLRQFTTIYPQFATIKAKATLLATKFRKNECG